MAVLRYRPDGLMAFIRLENNTTTIIAGIAIEINTDQY
jgi:hypothetical protein